MPTTQMQVRSDKMSFSLSQSGSGLLLKSRKATQIVLSPSQAIGSITFFTISSRSRGLKIRGSPAALRILEHLFLFMRRNKNIKLIVWFVAVICTTAEKYSLLSAHFIQHFPFLMPRFKFLLLISRLSKKIHYWNITECLFVTYYSDNRSS